jgi:hypothetical protein
METIEKTSTLEIWHRDFNLEKRDNLSELPNEKSVFGIFGIVDGNPVNCRYVGETEDLRHAVKDLFESPPGVGLKAFMRGAWIQMVQFELLPHSSKEQRTAAVEKWIEMHKPAIDENGEYPGYYEK